MDTLRKIGLAIAPLLALSVPVATALATEISILRGGTAETLTASADGPAVLRGGGSMRAKPPTGPSEIAGPIVLGGDTLWILGNDGMPKTACFLIRTEYVGRRKIHCTDERY